MKKIIVLVFFGLLLSSSMVFSENSQEKNVKQDIVELAPSDFKPSFTKDTVIKLNGIVARSLDVINEYDSVIGSVRESVEHGTKAPKSESTTSDLNTDIARINILSERSQRILADMVDAEKELKESGEHYNGAILAGMMDFVMDVEREISAQSAQLINSLSKT